MCQLFHIIHGKQYADEREISKKCLHYFLKKYFLYFVIEPCLSDAMHYIASSL